MAGRFCGRCGHELGDSTHPACERSLVLEPPRFCPHCGRRMVVQVTPTHWTARCSRDGELSHATG